MIGLSMLKTGCTGGQHSHGYGNWRLSPLISLNSSRRTIPNGSRRQTVPMKTLVVCAGSLRSSPPTLTEVLMEWSPQQAAALSQITQWLADDAEQEFLLFGYAGTSKTTLAKELAASVDGPVQFAAYTGKAASVMREKGCVTAQTLHSLVYTVNSVVDEEETFLREKLQNEEDPRERNNLVYALRAVIARSNKDRWIINRDGPLADARLLILDECSMVDEALGDDILSFGVPVLVLGDPGQLPPPHGAGFFTNRTPHVLLTEIHRQAAESPIIQLATLARNGKPIKRGTYKGADSTATVTTKHSHLLDWTGQILTGSNRVRRILNWRARTEQFGPSAPLTPLSGEPVIVLRNDRTLGIFNGVIGSMISDAVSVGDDTKDLRADIDYEGRQLTDLRLDGEVFEQYANVDAAQAPLRYNRNKVPVDYGYTLTVHKAQGSEWDSVCLVDDGFAWRDPALRAQWLYTAITRASHNLMIYSGDV